MERGSEIEEVAGGILISVYREATEEIENDMIFYTEFIRPTGCYTSASLSLSTRHCCLLPYFFIFFSLSPHPDPLLVFNKKRVLL